MPAQSWLGGERLTGSQASPPLSLTGWLSQVSLRDPPVLDRTDKGIHMPLVPLRGKVWHGLCYPPSDQSVPG